jgi:hypothetical protein
LEPQRDLTSRHRRFGRDSDDTHIIPPGAGPEIWPADVRTFPRTTRS